MAFLIKKVCLRKAKIKTKIYGSGKKRIKNLTIQVGIEII